MYKQPIIFNLNHLEEKIMNIYERAQIEEVNLIYNTIKQNLFSKLENCINEGGRVVTVNYTGEYDEDKNVIIESNESSEKEDINIYFHENFFQSDAIVNDIDNELNKLSIRLNRKISFDVYSF